jgi:hypothetical protein
LGAAPRPFGPALPPAPPIAFAARPPTFSSTAIYFALAAVRDGMMAFFIAVEGPFFMGFLLIPIPYGWVLALFPIAGLALSAQAARCAINGRGRDKIPMYGLGALAFSSFPGILILGPLGIALTAAGLLAHRRSWRRLAASPWAQPA